MRTNPRIVGALCATALLVTACSSGQADPADDPTTASPSATIAASEQPSAEPSSPDDPFAMPDPVTEEYVDRVVNAIYEEWGAITREILEQPPDPTAITPVETRERIALLFQGEYLRKRLEEADAMTRGDREGLLSLDEFTSITWTTRKLLVTDTSCIVAIGDFDTSGTASNGPSVLTAVSLAPVTASETAPANESGWQILDAQSNTGSGGKILDDQVMLDATLEDFGEILTTSCEGASS